MKIKQAVILCGGKGTRLGALTENCPKPLLKVVGRPFISHLMRDLDKIGMEEILLLVGPFADEFERTLGPATPGGARIHYVSEPMPAGTGGALHYTKDLLQEAFLMMNGDSYFAIDVQDFLSTMVEEALCTLALRQIEDASRFGKVDVDEAGLVSRFGEKSMRGSGIINAGLYAMRKDILQDIPADRPCSLEAETLPLLAARSQLFGRVYQGKFLDIGTPEDFAKAEQFILETANK